MSCDIKKNDEVKAAEKKPQRNEDINDFCDAMEEQQEGRTHFCNTIFDEDENNVEDKEDAQEFYEDLADNEVGAEGDPEFAQDFDGKDLDSQNNK